MNLIFQLLLISSLSISIIKSDPIDDIKKRIKKFISYEARGIAADTSSHNLSLEEEGYINESNFSLVWKGTHNRNQRVAVKISVDKDQFVHEVERYAALDAENPDIESHGIPKVYYCGPFLVYYYAIAMTLFDETLKDRFEKQRQQNKYISELSVLLIFKRGVEILEYMNEKGVLHNDIKPGNIFLRGQEVFIGDFNLASLHGYTDYGHTPEFASSNWYRDRKRYPMDDLESLVFSLWYVAGIPWDKPGLLKEPRPEGKTLCKCKKKDNERRGHAARDKMVEKSKKFKDPNVQEAMKLICSVEMLKRQEVPDYTQIIQILENAINKVHRDPETSPRFEWLTGESSSAYY